MKKAILITVSAIGTLLVILVVIGVAVGGGKTPSGHTTATRPSAPATHTTAPAAPVAATPDPKGTYQGSCDYTLGSTLGSYHLIGEVDLHNDGNIGTKDHVVITWPQEGAAPVKATKNVHSDAGARSVVRFKIAASSDVIDSLQSWQERHGYKDGCTYKVVITGTFGSAS